jgi:hypothetical protein
MPEFMTMLLAEPAGGNVFPLLLLLYKPGLRVVVPLAVEKVAGVVGQGISGDAYVASGFDINNDELLVLFAQLPSLIKVLGLVGTVIPPTTL